MSFRPYVKKPLFHSERGEAVLANITAYLIRTSAGEARVHDPGQCVAALRAAKLANFRCSVYALGDAYGMETMELVDEDFLLTKIGKQT
jgi:hypothetical protein